MLTVALAALLVAVPPVRIDAPTADDPYVSPLVVRGSATVAFTVELADWDGRVVARAAVSKTGRFRLVLRFPKGLYARGALIVRPARGAVIEIPLGLRVVSLDGISGIVPGATPAQVRRAWRTPLRLVSTPGSTCASAPVGVGRMSGFAVFLRNRFASVIFDTGAVTDTGLRIGSTLARLRRAYGARLTSRPDKYVPGARNYFVRKRWQLRFDVSKAGRITRIGFGDASVRLVEGCS